jgi:hypothetical protein
MGTSSLRVTENGLNALMERAKTLAQKRFVKVGILEAGQGRTSVRRGREARVSRDKEGNITGVRGGIAGATTARSSPTVSRGEGLSNTALAVIHEFGLPQRHIPSRPFLRSTFDAKRKEWGALLQRMAPLVLAGKLSEVQALELLGQRASADVKLRITTGGNFASNAPSTIEKKGSSRPLMDTGRLVQSISYSVQEP